jgi:ketosteroid isomerase-like protein
MENEILAETAALVTALESGDIAAAGGVYTDAARLLASSGGLIQGRAEIEAYWRAGMDLGLASVAFERRVLEELGGNVVEAGRYAFSVRGAVRVPLVERGSYLVLHSQAADGSWRRAVEVFNPDEPTVVRSDIQKEEQ